MKILYERRPCDFASCLTIKGCAACDVCRGGAFTLLDRAVPSTEYGLGRPELAPSLASPMEEEDDHLEGNGSEGSSCGDGDLLAPMEQNEAGNGDQLGKRSNSSLLNLPDAPKSNPYTKKARDQANGGEAAGEDSRPATPTSAVHGNALSSDRAAHVPPSSSSLSATARSAQQVRQPARVPLFVQPPRSAELILGILHKNKPKRHDICWVCGIGRCKGGQGCAKWHHHTLAPSSPVCVKDGGQHIMAASCVRLSRPPHRKGRCGNCFLHQDIVGGYSMHQHVEAEGGEAKEKALNHQFDACAPYHDRTKNIIFLFLRSKELRTRFVKNHASDLASVPHSLKCEKFPESDVKGLFDWLWDGSKVDALLHVDVVLAFIFKEVVLPEAKTLLSMKQR